MACFNAARTTFRRRQFIFSATPTIDDKFQEPIPVGDHAFPAFIARAYVYAPVFNVFFINAEILFFFLYFPHRLGRIWTFTENKMRITWRN